MIETLKGDKLLSFALIFVILQLALAVFAPVIAGDPFEQVIMARMQEPISWGVMFLRGFSLAIAPRLSPAVLPFLWRL